MIKETKEQKSIRKQDFLSGKTYKIIAYAGTGKTYILTRISKDIINEYPRSRILYLAYNTSMAEEARKKFPSRVKCSTVHAMAYGAIGRNFSHYQLKDPSKPQLASVPKKKMRGKSKWIHVNTMWQTVRNYICSIDHTMDITHVPDGISQEHRKEILIDAHSLWSRMKDKEDYMPITHDGYLKLYQLTNPDLGKNYDIVLMDEAQDCNGATLGIMSTTTGCTKIYVGDPHQQIYSWRGSINALNKVQGTTLHLSKSFRFGNTIATTAYEVLQKFKEETVPLKGNKIKDKIRVRRFIPKSKPITCISRTNAELFKTAVWSMKKKYKHAFVGGWDKDWGATMMDIYNLKIGNKAAIKNGFIKFFDTFLDLQLYAVNAEDYEITKSTKMVNEYGSQLPQLLIDVVENEVTQKNADVVLTTCHKCKGLEWDEVYITDDFCEYIEKVLIDPLGTPERDEEFNLIYVAFTRAKKKLHVSKNINTVLRLTTLKDKIK